MITVFKYLEDVRERPGLYIGEDPSGYRGQLRVLGQLLQGYQAALFYHGIKEPIDFLTDFSDFVYREKGWSVSCGAVAAICQAAEDDHAAWELFWSTVDEFRVSLEQKR